MNKIAPLQFTVAADSSLDMANPMGLILLGITFVFVLIALASINRWGRKLVHAIANRPLTRKERLEFTCLSVASIALLLVIGYGILVFYEAVQLS